MTEDDLREMEERARKGVIWLDDVTVLCAEVRRLRSILYAISVDIHNLQVETDCRLHGVDLEEAG